MSREFYISPFRCRRGSASVAALAANWSVISLYNNTLGQFMLSLHDINLAGGQTQQFNLGMSKGSIGTATTNAVNVIPETAALPGVIYTSQQAAQPTGIDYWLGNSNFEGASWDHEFAFATLPPGWSLWITPSAVNMAIAASLFWECVYTQNIAAPYDRNQDYLLSGAPNDGTQ